MISLKDFEQDSLLQSVAVAILSAGLWLLVRNRKKIPGPTLDQVPGPPVSSWWKGHRSQMSNLNDGWSFHQMLAEHYGPVVKLQTIFREMNSFPPIRMESGNVIFGNGLLGTVGEEHRKQRKMLNPVFSIAHMRSMMPMFNDIAQKVL
ncbi:hypothetical protein BT96DRAFT_1027446 [Gymnopus androsaceus JB14]|uniref:Cytochrome P450 n=1 Tax=Gymnopus androsaceus JB14 TaxID=1447944 RepID=A0A6A4GBR4_9AGAR|nr:hypothetical protein BT96DRAFT_1027446 [Gymnopus androsaceus JB14]